MREVQSADRDGQSGPFEATPSVVLENKETAKDLSNPAKNNEDVSLSDCDSFVAFLRRQKYRCECLRYLGAAGTQ